MGASIRHDNATLPSVTSAAIKILSRIEQRNLIEREQSGRPKMVKVTPLTPDGSGQPYERPRGGSPETRFIRLSHRF